MSKMSKEEIEAHENIIWGGQKWPLNKVVEDGQAICKLYQNCDRAHKGFACYENCKAFTPAT